MKLNVSIIVPVYNEEKILEWSIRNFVKYFGSSRKIGKFEIIIAENGSTDRTQDTAKKLVKINSVVKLVTGPEKSLGRALTVGIKAARYPYIYFNAIDNPFKFKDFEKFVTKISNYDLIFASKNHPQSLYKAKLQRKLATRCVSVLNKLLFGMPISDTQATFLGRKEALDKILPFCDAKGAFFQTQIAIYAFRNGLAVTEVPIHFTSRNKRSNFSLIKDGSMFLVELLQELRKFFNP